METFELASKLKHRVTFQTAVKIPDDEGGYGLLWQDAFEVWAEITPISASEIVRFEQVRPEISHRVLIRYRNDILPDMRILFENRILAVRTRIDDQERKIALILMCEEQPL